MSEKIKREITKDVYWQATGLLTLAHKYSAMLDEIEKSLNETLGCKKGNGDHYDSQVSDAMFNAYSIDTLLDREGITVKD
jgi:hypothetical protein